MIVSHAFLLESLVAIAKHCHCCCTGAFETFLLAAWWVPYFWVASVTCMKRLIPIFMVDPTQLYNVTLIERSLDYLTSLLGSAPNLDESASLVQIWLNTPESASLTKTHKFD
jgi:hypothetical protein